MVCPKQYSLLLAEIAYDPTSSKSQANWFHTILPVLKVSFGFVFWTAFEACGIVSWVFIFSWLVGFIFGIILRLPEVSVMTLLHYSHLQIPHSAETESSLFLMQSLVAPTLSLHLWCSFSQECLSFLTLPVPRSYSSWIHVLSKTRI